MTKIKRIIYISAISLVLILIASLYGLYKQNQSLTTQLSAAVINEKAYSNDNSTLKDKSREYQLTAAQLSSYNDSIVQKLNEVRDSLKIKDSNLKSLQYIKSSASKNDTINFTDTIYKDVKFNRDTIIGDQWYKVKLNMKYPNLISINTSFTSEKYIILSYKKETINPAKKWWLLRLFQKKHKVVEVQVIDKNPYVTNNQQKFIEIIK